ncbi:MAG: hypothetical protein ACLFSQ_04855 [Candidatus Zixiibacteriota bacterium]
MPLDIEKLNIDSEIRDYQLSKVEQEFSKKSSTYILGDITAPEDKDLQILLEEYSNIIFDNIIDALFANLYVEYSSRLTSAAGKAYISNHGAIIRISKMMIFETFDQLERDIYVNGIKCRTRLHSLMRVLEHELVHVLEYYAFGKTSCKRDRFRKMAQYLFGHTETTHRLGTMYEIAYQNKKVKPGSKVEFTYRGKRLEGIVSKITKRATVMSPDKLGQYIDQEKKRYSKFYVPIERLDIL